MTSFMLDTNICSYILRKDPLPSKRLEQFAPRHEVIISAVAYFELRKGACANNAPKGLQSAISEFVSRLAGVLPFDQEAADAAARIHADLAAKGEPIGGYDVMLAGHALAVGCTLVTNNTREFERAGGLTIEDWSA
jgi:tRNA(fMet)-specific endonuclease VapC